MAEKRKVKQKREIKEFLETTERFVLETDSTFERFLLQGDKEREELFLQLFQAMDVDERISFYFDNYESIFVSLFPDDVGYFQLVPSNKTEWEALEKDITKINPE